MRWGQRNRALPMIRNKPKILARVQCQFLKFAQLTAITQRIGNGAHINMLKLAANRHAAG
jgi:hypothetical protein